MRTQPLTRAFRLNGRTIPDPDPSLAPEQVRAVLATTDPSIASAVLQGPTYESGRQIYTFTTAIGTKG